jgi:flavin-dependent dehydrogenase
MEKDILIIGGGPAGLSTALHLAQSAPQLTGRILLLEKEHYPRHKLCAGGLVIDAERILQRLGLDVAEIPHVDAESAHFNFEQRGLKIRIPFRHALRIIRRDEFDAWLAQKAREAGIEIREGVTVKNVIVQADHVEVETDSEILTAQVVVGADGSKGVTRRCVLPKTPHATARLLEVFTPPKTPDTTATFDFRPVPEGIAGYTWDFPTQIKGQDMRCWGIYDANLYPVKGRPRLAEALRRAMEFQGYRLDQVELHGHPIHLFDPLGEMSVRRVLLVGDAAGTDPIFGEGISFALGYGRLAARELAKAFQRGEFSFSRFKLRVMTSRMGQALLARWLIAQLVYYGFPWRWVQFLMWRVFGWVVKLVAWLFVLNWTR